MTITATLNDAAEKTEPATALSPKRRWHLPASLAFTLTLSACGAVPFIGDDDASTDDQGQEIAAVEVVGIEPGDDAQLSGSRATQDDSGSSSSDSGSSESGSTESSSSESSSTESSSTPTSTQSTTESTVEAGPTPIEVVDDRFVGRTARYLVTDIEIGSIVTTNIKISDYLNGTNTEINDTNTTVAVDFTSADGGAGRFDLGLFGLIDAEGTRYNAIEAYTPRGDQEYSVSVESQATTKLVLVFPEVAIEGASFVVSEAGRVPAIIPFTETDTAEPGPYGFDVTPATPAIDVTADSVWDDCFHTFNAEILGATAALDGRDGWSFERTSLNERFLTIDIALTNITDTSLFPCGDFGPRPDTLDPRLSIDGTTMAPSYIEDGAKVEPGATVVARFTFRVPTGSHELVLTSITGDEISSWTIDLPSLPGE